LAKKAGRKGRDLLAFVGIQLLAWSIWTTVKNTLRIFRSKRNGTPVSIFGEGARCLLGSTMPHRLSYGTVRESPRQAIYVVRVHDEILEPHVIDEIASSMRERLQSRGEISADVVVVQGESKETLRLFGIPYSVERVRAAMFNAAISWTPIELD